MHTSAQWPLETQMAAMIASSMSYLKFLKMFRNSLTTKSHWCAKWPIWTEFGQVFWAAHSYWEAVNTTKAAGPTSRIWVGCLAVFALCLGVAAARFTPKRFSNFALSHRSMWTNRAFLNRVIHVKVLSMNLKTRRRSPVSPTANICGTTISSI